MWHELASLMELLAFCHSENITSGSMVAPALVLLSVMLGSISPLVRNLSASGSMSAAFIQWWGVVGGISCRERSSVFCCAFWASHPGEIKMTAFTLPTWKALSHFYAACREKEAGTRAKKSGLSLLLLSCSPLRERGFHRL